MVPTKKKKKNLKVVSVVVAEDLVAVPAEVLPSAEDPAEVPVVVPVEVLPSAEVPAEVLLSVEVPAVVPAEVPLSAEVLPSAKLVRAAAETRDPLRLAVLIPAALA